MENNKKKYRRLLKRHQSDPLAGLDDQEMEWLLNYEAAHPQDALVREQQRLSDSFDNGLLESRLLDPETSDFESLTSDKLPVTEKYDALLEQQLDNLAAGPPKDTPVQPEIDPKIGRSAFGLKNWPARAFAAAMLALFIFLGLLFFRPPDHYQLAKLTPQERQRLDPQSRSAQDDWSSAFIKGSQFLLDSEESHWGRATFNTEKLDSAIIYLGRSCQSAEDGSALFNMASFALGKAHLMKADPESAKIWFEKVATSASPVFQNDARRYLNKIQSPQ